MFKHLKNLATSRSLTISAAALLAAAAMGAAPASALARDRGERYENRWDDHRDWGRDRDRGGHVEIEIGGGSVERRDPVREERVWVEPVYRTVSERRYIEPVYRTVCDRVWVEAVIETRCERVWVPDRHDPRRGHFEDRQRDVIVSPAHYEDRPRQELVCAGHWENCDRQELVCAGHWETRTVAYPAPRREEHARFAIRLPF